MVKKVPLQIKLRVESERLENGINKLKKFMPEKAMSIVRDASVFFIQPAQKATPPEVGKTNIPRKKYYRTVFDMKDKNEKSARYKVPFRGMYKRGRRFFKYKYSAKDFSFIKYRGMARAGWFMNLLYLGEKIFTFKVAPDALALGKKFSLVQWVARGIKPVCEIENRVPNIERYASYSKAYGMGKAANRINYICRIEKKKIEDAGNVYIS